MAGSSRGVPVYNFTKTLNRGSVVRTLGSDFVLPFAIAFEGLAYGFVGFLLWSLPILAVFGVKFSVWYAALVFAPPILLGYVGTLRLGIFGDRSIASFLSAMVTFFFVEPAGWLQLKPVSKEMTRGGEESKVATALLWVSRERDLVGLQAARDQALIEYVSRDEAGRSEVDKIVGRKVR